MITVSHIVCPVDFSESSRHALDLAVAVAKWYDSRLSVVHVFQPPPTLDLPAAVEEATERERALGEIRRFTASVNGSRPLELRALAGAGVANTIVHDARETRADLLVLGSHGRSGFARMMLGSVTEDVIRRAPCPTLVVPRRVAEEPVGLARVHRILCAVDFSEASLKALEYAMTIAEESDADLTLLHVHNLPAGVLPESSGLTALDGLSEQLETAKHQLDALIPADLHTYCVVETVVRTGTVHREVLSTASDLRSDLIVMGVHGRGALDVMMFGSNTARVVRAATCPVLIVRRE